MSLSGVTFFAVFEPFSQLHGPNVKSRYTQSINMKMVRFFRRDLRYYSRRTYQKRKVVWDTLWVFDTPFWTVFEILAMIFFVILIVCIFVCLFEFVVRLRKLLRSLLFEFPHPLSAQAAGWPDIHGLYSTPYMVERESKNKNYQFSYNAHLALLNEHITIQDPSF